MLTVKNKKAIRNLSRKSFMANGARNLVAIMAIALTALLFTALFTVGGSMLQSMQQATMRQVGTEAHAGYKFLTQEQYDTVAADPKVKDISYNILIGTAENPEMNKTYTEIRYTEDKNARWSFSYPTTGRLPEEKYEICTSTAVLDALALRHELGQTVPLDFTVQGVSYHQEFTLCGFYEMDVALGASEAYVSRAYCDEVAPVIRIPLYEQGELDVTNPYAGTINPSIWFANAFDIDGKVAALSERCGFDRSLVNEGVNWAYASAEMDFTAVLLVVGILMIVLTSGYLIIYNVFYISVSRDIRFYGLLKTIGATGKQLKRVVRRQALLLCAFGIPLGLILGWLCGRIIVPAVMKTTALTELYTVSVNPLIFIAAALFALFTVAISCIRPARLAAKVSPVEAVRWTGVKIQSKRKRKKTRKVSPLAMAVAGLRRDGKKTVLVVISLTLSLVLLNATYTVINGFDMNKFLENMAVADFTVSDTTVINPLSAEAELESVTADLQQQVAALPGLEKSGCVWMEENIHTLSGVAAENAEKVVADHQEQLSDPYLEENVKMLHNEQKMYAHIYGIDEAFWDKMELGVGESLDEEKFATGDYVIATALWDTGKGRYYEPGDEATLTFANGQTKTYTVLAIGDIPYPLGPEHSHGLDICFTLPAAEYAKEAGEHGALKIGFNVDDAHMAATEAWVENYCSAVETNLDYKSLETYKESFRSSQMTYAVVGGALSIILAFIGILNFANAVVTSIYARRRELAMLQSVGMTGGQLLRMVMAEGLTYAAITLICTVTVGTALCWGAVQLITAQLWFFSYHFTLLPVLLCLPVLILISLLVPVLSYRGMAKHSVVERLREVE